MSRVFFIQSSSRFDVEPAKKFGDPVFVLDKTVNPFNPDKVMLEAAAKLRGEAFDPDQDYIGFTGQSILLALFFGLVLTGWPRVRILLFDARDGSYRERTVVSPFDLEHT